MVQGGSVTPLRGSGKASWRLSITGGAPVGRGTSSSHIGGTCYRGALLQPTGGRCCQALRRRPAGLVDVGTSLGPSQTL